ncbi:MAG: flagellar export chaperone FliS [Idiomarinaceae bacterium]|uniref:flagellar export chaperone FliS n=1 Tax=Idiomarina sp. 28-8 TaxID=1260624 RepID=UPI0002F6A0E3|nr:flagellar export chaperone FliS [Idiomarina sp. 28-8]NWO02280.1 flagellar export chaperone FliS [Idiomarinaceae bacterium]
MRKKGLNAYKQVGIRDQLGTADPYEVIQMLMQGGIDRMVMAKSAIEHQDYSAKSEHISRAIAIVNALSDSLRPVENGEEITNNLGSLYDFIIESLSEASVENSSNKVNDCQQILVTIKEGWDAIPRDVRESTLNSTPAALAGG